MGQLRADVEECQGAQNRIGDNCLKGSRGSGDVQN